MRKIFTFITLAIFTQTMVYSQNGKLELVKVHENTDALVAKGFKLEKKKKYIPFKPTTNVIEKSDPNIQQPNVKIQSPKGDYSVAFYEGEGTSQYLYFLQEDKLLNKHEVNIYAVANYSENGEYIIFRNRFGREIFVFTKTGKKIFESNYIDIIINNQNPLINAFVSNHSKNIILNAGNKIYLIDLNGNILWETQSSWAYDCSFNEKNKIIFIKELNDQNSKNKHADKYNLNLYDLNNGKLQDQIIGVSDYSINEETNLVLIKKNNKSHEYKIK